MIEGGKAGVLRKARPDAHVKAAAAEVHGPRTKDPTLALFAERDQEVQALAAEVA